MPSKIKLNDKDYELIYEYSSVGDNSSWTKNAPVNVGTYNVRITFLGSLTNAPKVVTSTLTINPISTTVSEEETNDDDENGSVDTPSNPSDSDDNMDNSNDSVDTPSNPSEPSDTTDNSNNSVAKSKGCGGSIVVSLFSMIALCGMLTIIKKKKMKL